MNRRQKKKAYKKKYGHNPPKTEIKYNAKYWGKIIARAVAVAADAITAAIQTISEIVADLKETAQATVAKIQAMPEADFIEWVESADLPKESKALAWEIWRKGQYGRDNGDIRENSQGESGTAGTEDIKGLHRSREDNAAGA